MQCLPNKSTASLGKAINWICVEIGELIQRDMAETSSNRNGRTSDDFFCELKTRRTTFDHGKSGLKIM